MCRTRRRNSWRSSVTSFVTRWRSPRCPMFETTRRWLRPTGRSGPRGAATGFSKPRRRSRRAARWPRAGRRPVVRSSSRRSDLLVERLLAVDARTDPQAAVHRAARPSGATTSWHSFTAANTSSTPPRCSCRTRAGCATAPLAQHPLARGHVVRERNAHANGNDGQVDGHSHDGSRLSALGLGGEGGGTRGAKRDRPQAASRRPGHVHRHYPPTRARRARAPTALFARPRAFCIVHRALRILRSRGRWRSRQDQSSPEAVAPGSPHPCPAQGRRVVFAASVVCVVLLRWIRRSRAGDDASGASGRCSPGSPTPRLPLGAVGPHRETRGLASSRRKTRASRRITGSTSSPSRRPLTPPRRDGGCAARAPSRSRWRRTSSCGRGAASSAGLEAYFTVLIELTWPKRRILEVYLNVAEMGDGVFGVEAASRRFFGKPAARIGPSEAALLAAVLPNPIRFPREPAFGLRGRARAWILAADGPAGGVALFDGCESFDPSTWLRVARALSRGERRTTNCRVQTDRREPHMTGRRIAACCCFVLLRAVPFAWNGTSAQTAPAPMAASLLKTPVFPRSRACPAERAHPARHGRREASVHLLRRPLTGGLWKTTNKGTNVRVDLPDKSMVSIGHATLAPSNPDIIWGVRVMRPRGGSRSAASASGSPPMRARRGRHMGSPRRATSGALPSIPETRRSSMSPRSATTSRTARPRALQDDRRREVVGARSLKGDHVGVVDVVIDPKNRAPCSP